MAGVTFKDREFRGLAKQFPRKTFKEIKRTMKFLKSDFEGKFQNKRLRGRPGLKKRSGSLARSLDGRVVGDSLRDLGFFMQIGGATAPYARIHEEGGTIRPKKGRFLTIPLRAAMVRTGIARGTARSFANTFVARSRRGALLIFQKTGKSIKPLFALVKSVTIPPRLKFVATWTKQRTFQIRKLNDALGRVVARANRG